MRTLVSDLPHSTLAALDRADAVLVRASAALNAADLFAELAHQRLMDTRARVDRLRGKMAGVKSAGRLAG